MEVSGAILALRDFVGLKWMTVAVTVLLTRKDWLSLKTNNWGKCFILLVTVLLIQEEW